MPETYLRLRWPDASESVSYSPSSIIERHFHAGDVLPLATFTTVARAAMAAASDRVATVHGHPCGLAASSLRDLEARAAGFAGTPDAAVMVLGITR